MEKYKVCVITATRAEYGLLRPLLFRLKNCSDIDLKLIVTGTHLSTMFGNTKERIIEDGFTDFIEIPLPLEDDSRKGMAVATGVAAQRFADAFELISPEILVVLGDRYEMLAAAETAHLMGIPIAHMCGGDVTEGAVDDAIRHCITKLSYLHFPCCEQSAERIIRMGEAPDRVYNVGEPGVENCLKEELLDRDKLCGQLSFPYIKQDYCVVTYHPVTMDNTPPDIQVYELIKGMDSFTDMGYIITKANADAGGRLINSIWEKEAEGRNNWFLVDSLGVSKYLSSVKYSCMVIGNSSSGLAEVPALGVPTINIGDRQKGRRMAKSVICCEPKADEIEKAMRLAMTDDFHKAMIGMELPFGDGTTSEQVMEVILKYLKNKDRTNVKRFYDLDQNSTENGIW